MQEWNWEKNNALGFFPDKIICGTIKHVWWKCKICSNEWLTSVRDRAKGTNCPKCALIKKAQKRHEIALKNNGHLDDKTLLKEWNYDKNTKSPNEYTKFSNESVWWKCSKCGYEWKAKIGNRTILG